MKILVLNSGSSSIKFQLFDMSSTTVLAGGLVEKIGESSSQLTYRKYNQGTETDKYVFHLPIEGHGDGLSHIAKLLLDGEKGAVKSSREIAVVGHRVVHGGERFSEPTVITDEVIEELKKISFLAPLHNPANLRGIEIASQVFEEAIQVAVFDTAFHQSIPEFAYRFAIPKHFYKEHGLRVYGFHGTSHAYVSREAARFLDIAPNALNAITVHLGNGCSMAAIRDGKSVDVSMGLTPVGGLMMGTRSGDVDPGLILFLVEHLKMTGSELDQLLNKESGLKGLAGDNDLRNVMAQYDRGDPDAVLAVTMYVYRIRKFIGAYTAVLGRVDAVVFTAGVGENSATIRSLVCSNLEVIGISLDEAKNNRSLNGATAIGEPDSKVEVLVVPTNEELEIAIQSRGAVDR